MRVGVVVPQKLLWFIKKTKDKYDKIYDYKGAIHEWALYSYMFPDKY